MYFRSRKKLQGEVSLSDSIETDQDGIEKRALEKLEEAIGERG